MNKMRDDQEFNINFVKIIERERCLYDKTMSEYRSKDMHDQIWKKISTEVKESGKSRLVFTWQMLHWFRRQFRCKLHSKNNSQPCLFLFAHTVPHCKERWRNLRACLTRHLKQQLHASDGSVFHKPYYLADHMKFVLPFTKSRSSGDKDTSIYAESSPITSPKDTKEIPVLLTSSVDADQHHQHHHETPTYTITAETDDNQQYVTFVQNANGELSSDTLDETHLQVDEGTIIASKGIHHSNYTNVSSKPIDIYEPSAKRSRVSNQETDDADLNFFRSLLPDTRMMTASQKRRFKMGIFQLIDSVLKDTDANA